MGNPKRSDSKEDPTVSFTKAQLEELVRDAVDAAVKVATNAFTQRLHTMEKALQLQRERTAALETELETARKAHLTVLADHNRLEQYSRRAHLRISGLPLEEQADAKQVVADFLSEKLRTKTRGRICVTRADLDAAHKLPARPLTEEERAKGKEERTPMIIVRFHSRELRDSVMSCRRSLKNTGCSLQDDLTKRNYQMLQSLKKCEKLDSVWTWNGKIFGKLKGKEKGDVYDIFDTLPL
jgi:hypothetical protein